MKDYVLGISTCLNLVFISGIIIVINYKKYKKEKEDEKKIITNKDLYEEFFEEKI